MYNGWKLGKFKDLVTDDMELVAQKIFKRIVKISREIKVIYIILSWRDFIYLENLERDGALLNDIP